MTKKKAEKALSEGKLYWNDPDPIDGNDYKVTYINYHPEISVIQYNSGQSEAEIFNHELEIR